MFTRFGMLVSRELENAMNLENSVNHGTRTSGTSGTCGTEGTQMRGHVNRTEPVRDTLGLSTNCQLSHFCEMARRPSCSPTLDMAVPPDSSAGMDLSASALRLRRGSS